MGPHHGDIPGDTLRDRATDTEQRQAGLVAARAALAGGWGMVLDACKGTAVVVEPDPHPTPWTVDEGSGAYIVIRDANGEDVVDIGIGRHTRATAERIVKAVNEATQ